MNDGRKIARQHPYLLRLSRRSHINLHMKNAYALFATILVLTITAGCASSPEMTPEQKDRAALYKEMMTDTATDLAVEGDEEDSKAANAKSYDKGDIDAETEAELF
jgi:hypothetical protein